MTTKITPDQFIALTRRTFGRYADMSGGCLKFSLLLHYVFPDRVTNMFYNSDHILTEIDGRLYDIEGLYKGGTVYYLPIREFGIQQVIRSFGDKITTDEKMYLIDRYAE